MNMILKIWNSTQRKRLYKKQRGNTLPLTVAMFDSDAVFL